MTTRYDRMRAAAGDKHRRGTSMIGTACDHDLGVQLCEEAKQLRADADELERAVVVPRMSEAQAWDAFNAYAEHRGLYLDTRGIYFTFWLAALRDIGAIRPDEKEGV